MQRGAVHAHVVLALGLITENGTLLSRTLQYYHGPDHVRTPMNHYTSELQTPLHRIPLPPERELEPYLRATLLVLTLEPIYMGHLMVKYYFVSVRRMYQADTPDEQVR